jgi:hypothetical protein
MGPNIFLSNTPSNVSQNSIISKPYTYNDWNILSSFSPGCDFYWTRRFISFRVQMLLYVPPDLAQILEFSHSIPLCFTRSSEIKYHDRTAWRCAFFVGKKMEAKDIHKEMLPIWAAKNAQRHAILSWYMYSGAPPSCNSCYVCTGMRIPIVVSHNKTR